MASLENSLPVTTLAARRTVRGAGGKYRVIKNNLAELAAAGLKHSRCGSLLAVAKPGHWFAYPWWEPHERSPDYAAHVDIHNKPGYDPCELFFGWPPPSVSQDSSRIRGSHGRLGPDRMATWAATFPLPASQRRERNA